MLGYLCGWIIQLDHLIALPLYLLGLLLELLLIIRMDVTVQCLYCLYMIDRIRNIVYRSKCRMRMTGEKDDWIDKKHSRKEEIKKQK